MPSQQFQRSLFTLVFAAAALFAAPIPSLAGENTLNLPPAEYKGLPKGTVVKLLFDDNRSSNYKITRSQGFELAYKVRGKDWRTRHALFGRNWQNAYTYSPNRPFTPDINSSVRTALRFLWPLKVGNRTTIKFTDTNDYFSYRGWLHWAIAFEVTGTEVLRLNDKTYATYVIREHAFGDKGRAAGKEREYTRSLWYHPDSGLILKAQVNGTFGDSGYHMTSVKFPEGTTTHALTPLTDIQITAVEAQQPAPAAQVPPQPAAAAPAPTDDNRLGLPPAEYTGLPAGTVVKLLDSDNRPSNYKVTHSKGYGLTYKVRNKKWRQRYALFGRDWVNAYTDAEDSEWSSDGFTPNIDADARTALRSFWPLKSGNRATIKSVDESVNTAGWQQYRKWTITFDVTETEHLRLNEKTYATYVIREHGSGGTGPGIPNAVEYTRTLWYHPGSGLILKAHVDGTNGESGYRVTSVTFPESTTTHALTPVAEAAPVIAAINSDVTEELKR
jgi:hypothetical protein